MTDFRFVDAGGTPYTELPVVDNDVASALGSDTGTPPSSGTGVRGWLRGIYDRLTDGTQTTRLTNGTTTANVTDAGALLADKPFITRGAPTLVSSSGNVVVYTPAVGKTPRLKWLYLAVQDDGGTTTVATVRWRTAGGVLTDIYTIPLGVPGIFAHGVNRDGPGVNSELIVNLSTNRPVYVNVDMEDFG